ncbi:MAG: outer membrane beta-barrel protein [Bacteroidota bacterium]
MNTLPKIICFLFLLISVSALNGQTHLGLKVGSMLTGIQSNNLKVDTRTSFHTGIFVTQALGEKLDVQAEFRYSHERMENIQTFGTIHMNAQVLRLPIELVYKSLSFLEIHAGPSLGYKLNQTDEIVSLEGIIPTSFRMAELAKWEAGIELGTAVRLGSRNKIGIRFYQALTPTARNDTFQGRQFKLGVYLSSNLLKS